MYQRTEHQHHALASAHHKRVTCPGDIGRHVTGEHERVALGGLETYEVREGERSRYPATASGYPVALAFGGAVGPAEPRRVQRAAPVMPQSPSAGAALVVGAVNRWQHQFVVVEEYPAPCWRIDNQATGSAREPGPHGAARRRPERGAVWPDCNAQRLKWHGSRRVAAIQRVAAAESSSSYGSTPARRPRCPTGTSPVMGVCHSVPASTSPFAVMCRLPVAPFGTKTTRSSAAAERENPRGSPRAVSTSGST